MPITAEIENVRKLESAGFSHDQAVVLTEIHEATAQDSVKELKEFIRSENKEFRSEIRAEIKDFRAEIKAEISGLELRLKTSQTDLLVKLFGIIFGCSSLVVAVLKLIL